MTIEMPSRYVYRQYHIDANRINSRQKVEAMNKLESWAHNGVIDILMSEVAMEEAAGGNSPARTKKAYGHIFSYTESNGQSDAQRMTDIENAIFPAGCANQNQKNDVEIVFNSGKYCAPLITDDGASRSQPGGILGARAQLRKMGITVLRAEEAISEIEDLIRSRDEFAHRVHQECGLELPDWYGRD
ncbi:MAG: hypothetical protein Q7L07_16590 [Pseudohongiella sp.]|nr:hypothetical protein [Pseudohongiella sp.]